VNGPFKGSLHPDPDAAENGSSKVIWRQREAGIKPAFMEGTKLAAKLREAAGNSWPVEET